MLFVKDSSTDSKRIDSCYGSHIGMIIHTTKLDTMDKVKAIYGGTTWVKIEGRFLLGQGSGYGINATGGEASHKLTVPEIPKHSHNSENYLGFAGQSGTDSYSYNFTNYSAGQAKKTMSWGETGGNLAHNNMPPYKVVYIWERTA